MGKCKLFSVFDVFTCLFRDRMPSLSSGYNISGLVPGVLVTFSMLCTETSETSKKLIYLDLSGRFSKR